MHFAVGTLWSKIRPGLKGGDGVIRARRFAARAALSGTVFAAGWVAGWLAGFGSPGIEITHAAPIEDSWAPRGAISVAANPDPVDAPKTTATTSIANVKTDLSSAAPIVTDVVTAEPRAPTIGPAAASVSGMATADPDPPEPASLFADVSAVVETPSPDSRPVPARETRGQLVSLFTSDPLKEYPQPAMRPVEILNECLVAEICIDDYLWSLYERTPKVDTNKVLERIKVKVKKKGKTRTVTKTITKYVVGDFTWKDPIAAQRAGMSLKDYVIGGMDRGFKLKLYRAFRAMDDAGLMPGITSAFRDDYRQAIASGNKAASDSSFHGGTRPGGYGNALAADLVSVKGETRMERYASSESCGSGSMRTRRSLGSGARISIETRRTSRRSMARNMPTSAAGPMH